MNVDTGELRALTEQVSTLGRKVSALTGRVTVMGSHLNRLDSRVYDDLGALILVVAHLVDPSVPARREPRRPAMPRTDRHMRLVK